MDSSAHWLQPQPQIVVVDEEEEEEGIRRSSSKAKAKAGGKDGEILLKCPRCNSSNTKFCYYNNYSLSQPRYFCKSCRRYWTAGGSLRNIPVGGASRNNKNKTLSSSTNNSINNTSSSSSSWYDLHDHQIMHMMRSNNGIGNGIGMSQTQTQTQRELIPFMPMPAAAAPPQPTSMCSTAPDHCHPGTGLLLFEEGEAATTTTVDQIPTNIISSDQNVAKLGDVVPPAFWNGIFGGGSW